MADLPGIEDELFSYAAGALDEAARVRVEALLDADPELRARLEWYEAVCDGVVQARAPMQALPSADQSASLVSGSSRHFLVYENYDALLEYNCAHAYALSVALLADGIAS